MLRRVEFYTRTRWLSGSAGNLPEVGVVAFQHFCSGSCQTCKKCQTGWPWRVLQALRSHVTASLISITWKWCWVWPAVASWEPEPGLSTERHVKCGQYNSRKWLERGLEAAARQLNGLPDPPVEGPSIPEEARSPGSLCAALKTMVHSPRVFSRTNQEVLGLVSVWHSCSVITQAPRPQPSHPAWSRCWEQSSNQQPWDPSQCPWAEWRERSQRDKHGWPPESPCTGHPLIIQSVCPAHYAHPAKGLCTSHSLQKIMVGPRVSYSRHLYAIQVLFPVLLS